MLLLVSCLDLKLGVPGECAVVRRPLDALVQLVGPVNLGLIRANIVVEAMYPKRTFPYYIIRYARLLGCYPAVGCAASIFHVICHLQAAASCTSSQHSESYHITRDPTARTLTLSHPSTLHGDHYFTRAQAPLHSDSNFETRKASQTPGRNIDLKLKTQHFPSRSFKTTNNRSPRAVNHVDQR